MRDNIHPSTSTAPLKYLQLRAQAGSGARLRRLGAGVALWAVAANGMTARPARAQAEGQEGQGGQVSGQAASSLRTPEYAMRVGGSFEISLPLRATVEVSNESGRGRVIRHRIETAQRRVVVEGLSDGVARVDVTWDDGSVHPYRFRVGTGVPQLMAGSSTWGTAAASAPGAAASSGFDGSDGIAGRVSVVTPPMEEPNITSELPPLKPSGGVPAFPTWTRPQPQIAAGVGNGRVIRIKSGLARFLTFRRNILSVYFSNTAAMDARAFNARTVAVTGTAPGDSTLAVSVAQSPTDVVGRIEIFTIRVEAAAPEAVPRRDALATAAAIRAAIDDPRVGVNVVPANGNLVAKLTGTVRDAVEENAAKSTAALFVPRDSVISSIIVDSQAPTLYQVLNPIAPQAPVSGESVLQGKLRQVTGNDSIELISLPGGLAVKAEVDSAADAEALLGLLPTLNTRVLPFIVVRGAGSQGSGAASVDASGAPVANTAGGSGGAGKYYGADRPILEGEDLAITRRLQEVTGIRTVSVVRTAQNALALYGTVRDRAEYETVRRYAVLLPLVGSGTTSVSQSRSFSSGGSLPAPGQSIGGAAGAASGAGGLNRAQFSPALQGTPQDGRENGGPYIQSQAQVTGGGSGTGAVAPAAPSTGGSGTGAGAGTGAIAPTSPGTGTGTGIGGVTGAGTGTLGTGTTGTTGTGAFGTGDFGTGFGTGFVPGYGAVATGGAGGLTQNAIQGSPTSSLGLSSSPGGLNSNGSFAQQPSAGYRQDINAQMFVRILDPNAQSVRRVTVESNIVEISRTSLKNLGVEAGSASILSETVTAGTAATAPTITINPATGQQTITPGVAAVPGITTRTINPSITQGVATLGNGFLGLQSFRNIDPLRFRLNALYQSGNARILSRPNLSAIEGADAQIVVGGERPVPSSVATGQAVGQSIVFRRFGIILTMRPTVLDDDTIILQIRADVTELASEYGINLNGALIPGERVRSVNTTLTVRPGDTFVLGGLITNDRRQQTSRIPILSSLPIIGSLFKSKRFENNESELAIFMTPRIDRIPVTVNGHEAVNRVPSLPPLPDSATGASAFGSLGTASTP